MKRTPSPKQWQTTTPTLSRGTPKKKNSGQPNTNTGWEGWKSHRVTRMTEQEIQQEKLTWGAKPTSGFIIQPSLTQCDAVEVRQAGTRVIEDTTGKFTEVCEAINAQPQLFLTYLQAELNKEE